MSAELAVELARRTLQITFWTSAPILIAAVLVALVISILQVMTAIQEQTVSTVPRLATVAAVCFFLLPWMLRRLAGFTVELFSDFHPYIR